MNCTQEGSFTFTPGLDVKILDSVRWNFPSGSNAKASACNAGDLGSIPWSGRSPGEGNGNTLQYPCQENPMDRGAWQSTVHSVAKSWTRLTNFNHSGYE